MLLSQRDDLATSPWLTEIYNEIATATSAKPLGTAVRIRDLTPLSIRLACVIIPLLIIAGSVAAYLLLHGWHQLFSPMAFVPRVGSAQIIDLQPGDVAIVAGQPLEITLIARCPGTPKAKLIFGKDAGADKAGAVPPPSPELTGSGDDRHRAAGVPPICNIHIDSIISINRFANRVEVARHAKARWYTATVVHQIKLVQLEVHIFPPGYTRQEAQSTDSQAGGDWQSEYHRHAGKPGATDGCDRHSRRRRDV